uniref:50S ribosomal protein 5 n=1 Tax=Zoysia japonica TaxID=309978 RepID=A0A516UX54_9POAL|nr:50S ribosomal protein 5 [Zoysia japonica]
MALLLSPTASFLALPSPPRSRAFFAAAGGVSDPTPRLQCKNLGFLKCPLNVTANRYSFTKKRPVLVHATTDAGESDTEQPEESKPAVKIEDMPLESKQKMIMEQRAKMKLAKKLRQRRKRLVRKRRLRKKGRWPPSKMKKLKNV